MNVLIWGLKKPPAEFSIPHPPSTISQWVPNKTCSSVFVLHDWLQTLVEDLLKLYERRVCVFLFTFSLLLRPFFSTTKDAHVDIEQQIQNICKGYNCDYSLGFCRPSQYSKPHCCNFSVMIISFFFFFFKQKIFFFFYPIQNSIQVVICFLCSL